MLLQPIKGFSIIHKGFSTITKVFIIISRVFSIIYKEWLQDPILWVQGPCRNPQGAPKHNSYLYGIHPTRGTWWHQWLLEGSLQLHSILDIENLLWKRINHEPPLSLFSTYSTFLEFNLLLHRSRKMRQFQAQRGRQQQQPWENNIRWLT